MNRLVKKIYLTTATFNVPAGIFEIIVYGCGGGGGGGGGCSGKSDTVSPVDGTRGGGGGGSAIPCYHTISVTPGDAIGVNIGSGGAGGFGGGQTTSIPDVNFGSDGYDGGKSFLYSFLTNDTVDFFGGEGGKGGDDGNSSGYGGAPVATTGYTLPAFLSPGVGAKGFKKTDSVFRYDGMPAPTGALAGFTGASGNDVSGCVGGGGGGGAGGGGIPNPSSVTGYPFTGGDGGIAGNGANGSIGGVGQDGVNPDANEIRGCGGGGGGAGGSSGGNFGGAGGTGGDGTAGMIIIMYVD